MNKHNLTDAASIFPIKKVKVGHNSYGTLNIVSYGNNNESLSIGNYCSIAGQVRFLLSGEHLMSKISTYPFQKIMLEGAVESHCKGSIIVGDDVWIGYGCTILSGVRIGQGAVVAAGAVVTKDIPPYSIVGGIPAKIIRKRFESSIIEYLNTIDYSEVNEEMIIKHSDDFNQCIENMTIDEVKCLLGWIPKKEAQSSCDKMDL